MMRTRVLRVAMVAILICLPLPAVGAPAEPKLLPVPRATCGPGASPETGTQGRVPAGDFSTGRAARGYQCNAAEVGRFAGSAGLKVFRYVDKSGRVCAFYDSTTFFPTDVPANLEKNGTGVVVLDMTNPAKPVRTANLTTPAMLTPHESLQLSTARGLLVAVSGNLVTYPGVVDVYDVSEDCRKPVLKSSTPFGVLGHESAISPDGRTFYASSTFGESVTAIDLSDPALPLLIWYRAGVVYHGMSVSDDGNRLYVANIGQPPSFAGGLQILDVSQIQARALAPDVPLVSELSWAGHSQAQITIPVRIQGARYLVEVDEFATTRDEVGAARLISIADERNPRVVSNLRLEVHQPVARGGITADPGASSSQFGGYSAHYCSVPRREDPGLVACSFILSGLRVFDIRNPLQPREVAYFNRPVSSGSNAMAAPAWDLARGQVWYSDTKSGFYAVQLTNQAAAALRPTAPVATKPPSARRAVAEPKHDRLPATGASLAMAMLGFLLLLGAVLPRRKVA